jgi:hypothetical protein
MAGDYSDVLTDEERIAILKQEQDLTKDLMNRVQGKAEALAFLSTELGLQMRKFIALGKAKAMKEAAIGDADQALQGRMDYQVWTKLESIFGEIIVSGAQAAGQLENILKSEVTHENE